MENAKAYDKDGNITGKFVKGVFQQETSYKQTHHFLGLTPTNFSQSDNLKIKSPILIK